MQKYTRYLFCILILASIFIVRLPLISQNIDMDKVDKELKKSLSHAGGGNSMGRLFYIAFPPNDLNVNEQVYGCFITSSVDTKVRLSNPNTGLDKYYVVRAYIPTAIVKPDLNRSWEFKPNESEEVNDKKVIEISAPVPISVYVINSCEVSTDGYLAIPVSAWGKKYMHLAYWDMLEAGPWGAGFIVMASEDKTKVSIKLAGQGKDYAKTQKGRKIGQSYTITLNKGEGYMVIGDATTRGVFDLSGTLINADHPVGLISFHQRAMIPCLEITNGRDHMCEMLPPIDRWGKRYATTELARGKDKGDYFRVIGSEDNTTVKVKWYDKSTKKLVGRDETILKKAGEFWELYEIRIPTANNTNPPVESIRGNSVFEADKPILVMQHSYSANWDGDATGNYDPFMMLVTPVEQYTNATIFQTPSNNSGDNDYQTNFFNIVAVGDTSDQAHNYEMLSSIMLDAKPMVAWEPSFSQNNIPGTNLFWAFVKVQQGAHVIFGNTPFGGYIYGYASFDSYGWPAATAYKVIGEQDIFPPVPVVQGSCGEYIISATELRNVPEWDTAQVETGVAVEPELLQESNNFDIPEYMSSSDDGNLSDKIWMTNPPHYKAFKHKFSVINKRADAYAKIEYVDEAENDTIVEIRYVWDSLTVNPDPIIFPDTRVNTNSNTITAVITSHSDSTIIISSVGLSDGTVFGITEGAISSEYKLAPHDSLIVKIKYKPIKEYIDVKPMLKDTASLEVVTKCVKFAWPIEGRGVQPQIAVDDWDAGTIPISSMMCSDNSSKGYKYIITNNGTMDLEITGIKAKPTAEFDMPNVKLTFDTPVIVPKQGGKVNLFDFAKFSDVYKMCFQTNQAGSFEQEIEFISNATGPDPIGKLSGRTIGNGPVITSYEWPEVRVNKTENATLTITNLAPDNDPTKGSTITLKDIVLKSNSGLTSADFEIDYNNIKDEQGRTFTKGMKIFPLGTTGGQPTTITVPVKFHPSIEQYNITDNVVASFNEAESIEGNLLGTGFLPAIKVTGNVFPNRTFVGTYHLEGNSTKTIKSVRVDNTTAIVQHDLKINSIQVDNSYGNPGDFEFIDIKDANGNSLSTTPGSFNIKFSEFIDLECYFKPTAIGDRKIRFIINSDEGPWNITLNQEPKTDNTDGEITAKGMDADQSATSKSVGNVLACYPALGSITVVNGSPSDDLTVKAVDATQVKFNGNVISLSQNPFVATASWNNTLLKAGTDKTIDYSWAPSQIGSYEVEYSISFEPVNGKTFDPIKVTLTGVSYEHYLEFSINTFNDYIPGRPIDPYPIKVKNLKSSINTDYYSDTQGRITKFEINLTYNKSLLKFVEGNPKVKSGNALSGTWVLDAAEANDINNVNNKILKITGTTTNGSISGDGDLVTIVMTTLLGDSTKFRVNMPIDKVSLWDAANNKINTCVIPTTQTGTIDYNVCAQNLRNLATGNVNYSLQDINPNVVSTPSVDVNFGLAFNGQTNIDLVNVKGEIVAQIYNQNMNAGEYSFTLNTDKISNGTYFIRLVSGAFSDTKQIIIAK